MKKNIYLLSVLILLISCQPQEDTARYPVLLNMVHHNPGEPLFKTQYAEPAYLKALGYTGQVPKIEIQCGLTYDRWKDNVIPEKSDEKLWIERHAAEVKMLIDIAEKSDMPLYPFTDVLVIPKTIMEKYGSEMRVDEGSEVVLSSKYGEFEKTDGRLSILRKRTQEILRAQIDELFWRFPKLGGLTIRFGETYTFDTPFHVGGKPVKTHEEHVMLIKLLREEVCEKRDKKLFYRTWGYDGFHHPNPDFYLKVVNEVEPHPNLYFSIKHTNNDFLRDIPFNKSIGIGKHQQIVEISTNQAGLYGRQSHPYYIGKGVIDSWSIMHNNDHKGISSLYDTAQIKGFWIWTWGDGWVGPYINNELWVNLNEYVIRNYTLYPQKTEEEIFNEYATNELKLSDVDAKKFRELCIDSEMAVYRGQYSEVFGADVWWCRDQYLTALNLDHVVKNNLQEEVLAEKRENIKLWKKMEKLANEITIPDMDDDSFLKVSTTYGRMKYEIIELIWKVQIILADQKINNKFDEKEAKATL
ncbi:MAG: hypothetical protein KAH25_00775, partial [Bacteroidales bacterium]|nr:hypothetical protein [Bacteroidales bacterium]